MELQGEKENITIVDDMIVEAILELNHPKGSNTSLIFQHIQEQGKAPPNLEWQLAKSLMDLTENGKLAKVSRHRYKIAVAGASGSSPSTDSKEMPTEGDIGERMKNMSISEAETFAARAVAVAEAALEAALRATKEAEEAEAIALQMTEALKIQSSDGNKSRRSNNNSNSG